MNARAALLLLVLVGGCGGKEDAPDPLAARAALTGTAEDPLAVRAAVTDTPPKECKVVPRTGRGCDTEGIIATVRTQIGPEGGVARCYRTHETQRRTGKLSFTIQLGPDGKAQSVRVGSDAIGNAKLAGCLQRVLADLQYPAPGDKPCMVVYPFDFR